MGDSAGKVSFHIMADFFSVTIYSAYGRLIYGCHIHLGVQARVLFDVCHIGLPTD
jgi:hypothetical protein